MNGICAMEKTVGHHIEEIYWYFGVIFFFIHFITNSIARIVVCSTQKRKPIQYGKCLDISDFFFVTLNMAISSWRHSAHSWSFLKYFLFEHCLLRYQINCFSQKTSCLITQIRVYGFARNVRATGPAGMQAVNENVEGDSKLHCIDKNAAIIKIV